MQQPLYMKISELSVCSCTPASTIRYYLRKGLLPEPLRTSKNMAYYSQGHLERLTQIKEMQTTGLSLASINDRLALLIPADAQPMAI